MQQCVWLERDLAASDSAVWPLLIVFVLLELLLHSPIRRGFISIHNTLDLSVPDFMLKDSTIVDICQPCLLHGLYCKTFAPKRSPSANPDVTPGSRYACMSVCMTVTSSYNQLSVIEPGHVHTSLCDRNLLDVYIQQTGF